MTYPDRLKQALDLKGWRQADLVAAMKVAKQVVNSCVVLAGKGIERELSASNSAKAAKLLGVSHHWLATGEGEPVDTLEPIRAGLSPRAVHLAHKFDAIDSQARRDSVYALVTQIIDFGADAMPDPARTPEPVHESIRPQPQRK